MERDSRKPIVLLKNDRWYKARQTGSHLQFKHPVKAGILTVPHPEKDLRRDTVASIYKRRLAVAKERMRYIAFIHSGNEPRFGIGFPDFPGCVSDGGAREAAICRGREALAFHLEGMAEYGMARPQPRSRHEIEADPDLAEWRQGAEIVCIDDIPAPPPLAEEPGDPLLRSVGGIFGRSLALALKPFLVPDLPVEGGERVKAILVLESPHRQEVVDSRPLSGKSGKSVAEKIREYMPNARGISGAIGKLVAEGDSHVSWLGIVNACRLPLQAEAYSGAQSKKCRRCPAWSECIPWVRKIQKRRVNERKEAAILLERAIAQDLQARMDRFVNGRRALLICCGETAQRIFESTNVQNRARIAYAPHPSNGLWSREEYRDGIRKIFRNVESDLRSGTDA